jgi:hypothetical protein
VRPEDLPVLHILITLCRADANIMMNVTQVGALGEAWNSSSLSEYASSLSSSPSSANAGNLVGNRLFWSNDYMVRLRLVPLGRRSVRVQVHRGSNYVTTLKMYSSRTNNTEDINSQNVRAPHPAFTGCRSNLLKAVWLSPRRRGPLHLCGWLGVRVRNLRAYITHVLTVSCRDIAAAWDWNKCEKRPSSAMVLTVIQDPRDYHRLRRNAARD